MAAAAFDRLAVLRELLEHGADVHARCDQVRRRLGVLSGWVGWLASSCSLQAYRCPLPDGLLW